MPGFNFPRAVLFTLTLSCTPVWAQVCSGAIGPATRPIEGERFTMMAEQCPGLAAPLTPHRAAQLDLYDKPTRTIADSVPAAAPKAPTTPAVDPKIQRRPPPATPPTRDAIRVITLAPAITAAALEFQIDPLLLHSVAHIESRHNTEAVSHAGARGVMQMMPATGKRFGVEKAEYLHKADVNLRASAAYLSSLRQRYGDDLKLTLAAYNAGEGAVAKYGGVPPYAETQAYVRKVMTVYRRLGEAFSVSPTGQLIARGE